jgi:hypothetical protein
VTRRTKLATAAATIAVAATGGLVGSDKICACGTPQVGDQTPPAVSVSGPAAASTVSGTISVTATATDDKGVAGVQFKRGGSTNVGAEDTSAPFSVSLDTTALSNGALSLTAVARDAAGNTTTSAAVAVTVDNGIASGTANIWVDTDGGTCVDNGSAVSYSSATACGSLDDAVAIADLGDNILIRTGTYPFDTIGRVAALEDASPGCDPYGEWGSVSTTNCVHIQPDGGDVWVHGAYIYASSLWFEGNMTGDIGEGTVAEFENRDFDFHFSNQDLIGNPPVGADVDAQCNCRSVEFQIRPENATGTSQRPDHVILDKIDSDTMSTFSASNILWRNMDIGPLWIDTDNRGSQAGRGPLVPTFRYTGTAKATEDVVVDSTFFHEMNRTWWCDLNNVCHPDGLYIIGGDGYEIRNTGFTQISGEVLFFEMSGAGDTPNLTNFLMENSWMGCKVQSYPDNPSTGTTSCGTSSTPFDIKECGPTTGCTDVLFRYNSFYSFGAEETNMNNVRFVGNASRQMGSTSEPMCALVTFSYNALWTRGSGTSCNIGGNTGNLSTGSGVPTSLWVNSTPGSEDYHLAGSPGSTAADNLVTPTSSDYTLTTDIDGNARTAGSRDAGAFER